MDSRVADPVAGSEPIVTRADDPEKLLDLTTKISADGDSATFSVVCTNHRPFKIQVGIEEMAPILNEIRHASNMMMSRQRLKLDRGANTMLDLVEFALTPSHIEILVDPTNGDRIFIMLFEDHAPMAIRLTSAETELYLQDLAEVCAKTAN